MAIADTGKAEAQPLSPDAYQAQQAEIARLSQAVQLAEVENQGLRARVAELENNERKTLELLKDGHGAHVLILRGDIAISRRQMAHLLGEAYQDLFAQTEGENKRENFLKPLHEFWQKRDAARQWGSDIVMISIAEIDALDKRVAELEELLEMQRGATDAVIADKKRILEMSDAAIGVLQARGAELSAECERLSYLEAWVAKREEYEAQSERLQNTCGLVVAENKRLSARVDEVLSFIARHPQFAHEFPSSVTVSIETPLETPQNPSICLQEPPVVVSGGDSASEYAGVPWEGRP